jgi:hypothetical protein
MKRFEFDESDKQGGGQDQEKLRVEAVKAVAVAAHAVVAKAGTIGGHASAKQTLHGILSFLTLLFNTVNGWSVKIGFEECDPAKMGGLNVEAGLAELCEALGIDPSEEASEEASEASEASGT